ncbi:LptF/LptG family permease [Rubellicoccus peritrichatus]|uniref:LptF/LptG family permease n=1 Tax=Rubellicoccus peritrichatus TaxID=3080537 RepID=A0AAQ3LD31_9BACT|nr:LptF/LptG family permease [Puniceicoccus sp. CR14]WOO39784.1 LptF/LptG family permease [Puniceicoccus sp. CR14]
MRLLDRYLFIEWLKTFILAMAATLGVLLLEDIQDDLEDFFRWGATSADIIRYYAFLIPSFLPTIIPLSLLISLLFVLGNLHRNNEIVAMRASGMNLFRITRSLWLGGILLSGLMFYLNAQLIPQSVESSRTIRENFRLADEATKRAAKDVGIVPQLGFDNRADGRLWFMNRFSEFTNDGFGVSVYQRDEAGRETSRVMSREAYFDETEGYWTFIEGREFTFDPDSGEAIRSLVFDEKSFPDYQEDPTIMITLNKRSDDLSLFELKELIETIPPEDNPRMHSYAVRYQTILANPFSCLVVVGIAIPFAVAGVRTNPLVGVTKAGGLFFAYFIVASIFRMLGEKDTIPVNIAAWAPIVLMFLVGLVFFKRVS